MPRALCTNPNHAMLQRCLNGFGPQQGEAPAAAEDKINLRPRRQIVPPWALPCPYLVLLLLRLCAARPMGSDNHTLR
jgi:hypothetical protein